jgi:hypothetical protein
MKKIITTDFDINFSSISKHLLVKQTLMKIISNNKLYFVHFHTVFLKI